MNRYLFTTIFAMICLSGALFSCEKEPSSEDKAKETAGLFAKYYYTWRLADAISLTDENMELRIRFLSSNVHKADIEVLHGATETPEIEVDDITMEDDSNAIATVLLDNVYMMDTLGTKVHLYKDVKKKLKLKLIDAGWRVVSIEEN